MQTEQTKQKRKNSWTDQHRAKAAEKRREQERLKYENSSFDELSKRKKKIRILEEQNYKCLFCENEEWLGQPITLELDHIDGNKQNNLRNNLRCLCPNCHSTTDTWRRRKICLRSPIGSRQ